MTEKYSREIRTQLAFMSYVPLLFVSALTKQRVVKILELVNYVEQQQCLFIQTNVLNEVLNEAVLLTPPPTFKGKKLKIFYGTQVEVKPPHFILFVNEPNLLHFSYRRYLENKIRENFGFEGVAIRLTARRRRD